MSIVRAAPDVKHRLIVTGVPFNKKDEYGTTFTSETDYMEDYMRLPPVFYYHGAFRGRPSRTIAKATDRFVDDEGVKFVVQLNPDDPLTPMLWQQALNNNLYASTGVVPASYSKTDTGLVRSWFIGDLSIFELDPSKDQIPASLHAIATPVLEDIVRAAGRTLDGVTFDKTRSDLSIPALRLDSPAEMTFMQKLQQALKPLMDFINQAGVTPGPVTPVDEPEPLKEDTPQEEKKETEMNDVTRDAQIADLQKELELVRAAAATANAKAAAADFSNWLDANVSKRIAPADREACMSAFAALRAMDETVRSGSTTGVDVLKGVLKLFPDTLPLEQPAQGLVMLGTRSTQQEGEVDPAYVKRMRQYTGA